MVARLRQLEQQNRLLKVGLVAILASAVCGAFVSRPGKPGEARSGWVGAQQPAQAQPQAP